MLSQLSYFPTVRISRRKRAIGKTTLLVKSFHKIPGCCGPAKRPCGMGENGSVGWMFDHKAAALLEVQAGHGQSFNGELKRTGLVGKARARGAGGHGVGGSGRYGGKMRVVSGASPGRGGIALGLARAFA